MIAFMFAGAMLGTAVTFSYNLIMYAILRLLVGACFVGLPAVAHCIGMWYLLNIITYTEAVGA